MTFHIRRGEIPFPEKFALSVLPGWGTKLLFIALMAIGVAFFLWLPGMSVWAGHPSPISPVSPVPTETDTAPTPLPTVPIITPAPRAVTPAPSQPIQGGERGKVLLVAGGIVIAGLIAGAVVFLLEGVMSS